jgi:biotin operon repressor
MKEYRLAAWPDLEAPYHRIGYQRMLSEMSQRFVSPTRLAQSSGLTRAQVREFIEMLEARGLLWEREVAAGDDSLFDSLGPLGGWIRRTFAPQASQR